VRVDLYTDAGIKDRVATWATVAIVPEAAGPIEASGRLRADTHCTATAELRAIANALHKMITRGDIRRGDEVRVLTDSRAAVERISGRQTKRPQSMMANAVLVIRKAVEVHGITVSAVWIPGHKPDSHSPHARWNNRCDALCRAARQVPAPAKKPAGPSKARKALDMARKLSGCGDRPFAPPEAAPLARERLKLRRTA
jgi:ribonuclease HI